MNNETQTSEVGRHWRPVAHDRLIRAVEDEFYHLGWTANNKKKYVYDKQRSICARWVLSIPLKHTDSEVPCTYAFGVTNSNSQRSVVSFYGGVYDGSMPVFTRKYKGAKHTIRHEKNLETETAEKVREFRKELRGIEREMQLMKLKSIKWEDAKDLIYLAQDAGMVACTKANKIRVAHESMARYATGWSLVRAFVGVVMEWNTPRQHLEPCYNFYQLVFSHLFN